MDSNPTKFVRTFSSEASHEYMKRETESLTAVLKNCEFCVSAAFSSASGESVSALQPRPALVALVAPPLPACSSSRWTRYCSRTKLMMSLTA